LLDKSAFFRQKSSAHKNVGFSVPACVNNKQQSFKPFATAC